MTNYSKGVVKERRHGKNARAANYYVVRAAGSKGETDLVLLKPGHKYLVQAKGGPTPFGGFPPKERLALSVAARKAGAQAVLAWMPDGQSKAKVFSESRWPATIHSLA